jgi:hypothetical protein
MNLRLVIALVGVTLMVERPNHVFFPGASYCSEFGCDPPKEVLLRPKVLSPRPRCSSPGSIYELRVDNLGAVVSVRPRNDLATKCAAEDAPALYQWKFKPARKNGSAISTVATVEF